MSDKKVQWLRDRRHLCISPYSKTDFRIRHNGFRVSCCCNLDIEYSTEIGTTELVDSVATTMDQGQAHPACWRCYDEEDRGHLSERIRGMINFSLEELEEFNHRGFRDPKVEIGMKFSNLCNLGCRSCGSSDSSTFEKITKLKLRFPGMAQDLSEMTEYWNMLLDHIDKKFHETQTIIILPIGGETFIQPGFHKLLDWLIEQDFARRSILRITTSFATPISDSLIDKFKRFKRVELLASVDSVGENYHHVRWPAKFEKIERNLEILIKLNQEYPTIFPVAGVMPIFSLNNIFYLDEILDYWSEWKKGKNIIVFMETMHLYRPIFLSIHVLPIEYRSSLIEILERCRDHDFFRDRANSGTFAEYITSTIDILKSQDGADENLFSDYLKFSADYDKRTGSDSFSGNSKLFDLLSPEHVEIYKQHHDSANITIPIHYNDNDHA